jgi:uncharacterized protein (DUF2141 family)
LVGHNDNSIKKYKGMRIFTFVLLLICLTNSAESQQNKGSIEILITNIDNSKLGYLWIGLYNNKNTFGKLDGAIKVLYIPVKENTVQAKFTDVTYGTYSINIFHDENSNGDIDKNFFGIPKEGYGFSNNPYFFGPPSFEKTKFIFSQPEYKTTIKMCY